MCVARLVMESSQDALMFHSFSRQARGERANVVHLTRLFRYSHKHFRMPKCCRRRTHRTPSMFHLFSLALARVSSREQQRLTRLLRCFTYSHLVNPTPRGEPGDGSQDSFDVSPILTSQIAADIKAHGNRSQDSFDVSLVLTPSRGFVTSLRWPCLTRLFPMFHPFSQVTCFHTRAGSPVSQDSFDVSPILTSSGV